MNSSAEARFVCFLNGYSHLRDVATVRRRRIKNSATGWNQGRRLIANRLEGNQGSAGTLELSLVQTNEYDGYLRIENERLRSVILVECFPAQRRQRKGDALGKLYLMFPEFIFE